MYYDSYCYLPLYIFCGGSCSATSCAPPTSTGPPARSTRSPGSSPASGPAGSRCRSCCAAIRASAARSWRGARPRVSLPVRPAPNARLKAVLARGLGGTVCTNHRQGGSAVQGFRLPDDLLEPTAAGCRKAEHLPDGANPRFVVTSLGREKITPAASTKNSIAPAARWSHQGMPARPVRHRTSRRPCRPTNAPVVRVDGLRAAQRVAPDRAPPHPVCRCHLRHHRLKLLKIGALVRRSVRRIKFAMASGFPWQTSSHSPTSICNAPSRDSRAHRPRPIQAPAPRHVPARARLRP